MRAEENSKGLDRQKQALILCEGGETAPLLNAVQQLVFVLGNRTNGASPSGKNPGKARMKFWH